MQNQSAVPTSPRLVLVDQENLSGRPPRLLSVRQIEGLSTITRRVISRTAEDEVIVAANPAWRLPLARVWNDAELRFRGGPDGADLELCGAVTSQRLRPFAELWILSGDGRFAAPARLARGLGLRVVVMSVAGSLARSLRHQADVVKRFPSPNETAPQRWAA